MDGEIMLQISEILANLAQAAVVMGAGIFFLLRWTRGWIYTNLTLTSKAIRTHNLRDEMADSVIVSIKLEKGDRANARLQSIVTKAFDLNNSCKEVGEQKTDIKNALGSGNLNLPPGESMQFEELFSIDKNAAVKFETTVTAHGPTWKTSAISLPIGESR